jgi:periplasmic divalent cation tolerance protein
VSASPVDSVPDALVVLVTGPDRAMMEELARTLVEERLAACVNVLDRLRSIYRWEGAVEEADEVLAILKTTRGRLGRLERRVSELHPYEVPEVLALPLAGGSEAYLAWIVESVQPADDE